MLRLTLFLLAVVPFTAVGQSALNVKEVAAFKNGIGFFYRSGTVQLTDGAYRLTHVPEALFGTLWAGAPGNRVAWVHRTTDTAQVQRPYGDWAALLKANEGKRVRLYRGQPENITPYEAVVEKVLPNFLSFRGPNGERFITPSVPNNRLDFLDAPKYTGNVDSTFLRFTLHFLQKRASQPLTLYYLQRGLQWLPVYRVELLGNDKARVNLQARLTNDAEDLVNTTIKFTVGVPNFRYASQQDPLVTAANLGILVDQLRMAGMAGAGAPGVFDNIATQSRSRREESSWDYPEADEAYAAEAEAAMDVAEIAFSGREGTSAEDLFFYEVDGLTLKKGDRASVELLDIEVPYEDLFEARLNNNTLSRSYYTSLRPTSTNQVTHILRLHNTGTQPWTTGSALLLKPDADAKPNDPPSPLSQDELEYTAPGDKVRIKLTTASDVVVEQEEEEIGRKENIKLRDKYYYDQISIKAKVTVENYRKDDIKLTLKRQLHGKLEEKNSSEPFTTKTVGRSQAVNPLQDVTWEPTVRAGGKVEFTYEYEVYVRR